MKIAVYLAAVPKKTKNQFKRDLLTNFAYGAKKSGDEVWLIDDYQLVDADIAVLQGWIGMKEGPHLTLRANVIKQQRKSKKHTVVIDSNLFGFLEPDDFNRYLRYSLDGIFPTTGDYFARDIDPARWIGIKQNYNFVEQDWKRTGQHILLCLQRDGGWSMDGLGVCAWLNTTIPEIRKYTDRPIIIRGHPGSTKIMPEVAKSWPNVIISQTPDIRTDFNRAWATITYNSSPGVASLLWGIPTWVTDPVPERSQAWPEASNDLSTIENPILKDRTEFYYKLAQCHFNQQELVSGAAWQFMRQRLPNT
jgi:hypothetical protein